MGFFYCKGAPSHLKWSEGGNERLGGIRSTKRGESMHWDQDKYNRMIELRRAHSQRQTAEIMTKEFKYPFSRSAIKNREKRPPLEFEKIEKPDYKETIEIGSDGSHKSDKLLKMSDKQSKDTNYLLISHGYDPKEWKVVNAKSSIWNQHNKQDGTVTLYASKITAKPIGDEVTSDNAQEIYRQMAKGYKTPVHKPIRYSKQGKMLELNIADLHLGKLCWSGDSNDNYDMDIAKKRFFHIINDVLTRTKDYKFSKILFVFSNDFFHYDTLIETTTAGTRQDSDTRWQKLYKTGVQMLVEAIDLISQQAPVETFYIGSNHDKMTAYFAIEHLNAWFRNHPHIKINADPKSRKYIEFGNSLIQFSHGHSEKKRLGHTMQVEAREAWGRTLYHEVHAGHIHSEKAVTEENGVIIRHISSPTGTDNWHYEQGYVGAVKKAQSFIWDPEYGLEMIINTPIVR